MTAVILLDVILCYWSHADRRANFSRPAGHSSGPCGGRHVAVC